MSQGKTPPAKIEERATASRESFSHVQQVEKDEAANAISMQYATNIKTA